MKPGSITPAPRNYERCFHCGADEMLHQASTDRCPANGQESGDVGATGWRETIFTLRPQPQEVAATSDLKYDHLSVLAPSNGEVDAGAVEVLGPAPERPIEHFFAFKDGVDWLLGWQRTNVDWKKLVPVSGVAAPTGGSEAKHTPGPWRVGFNDTCPIWGIDNTMVAAVYPCEQDQASIERMRANAELIARAPETARELAALKALLADVKENWLDVSQGRTTCNYDVLDRVNTALGEKTDH